MRESTGMDRFQDPAAAAVAGQGGQTVRTGGDMTGVMAAGEVWVVDDDHSIRWVLERALVRAGFGVRTFAQVDEDALRDVEVSQVGGDAHVADHRPSHEGDSAPVVRRGVEHLLDPVDVGREGGDTEYQGRLDDRA